MSLSTTIDTKPIWAPCAVHLDAAGATSVGQARERNEDQFLIASVQRTLHIELTSLAADAGRWLPGAAEGRLLVVADGMGGHGGGDVASAVAVHTVAEYLCSVIPWFDVATNQTSTNGNGAHGRGTLPSLGGVRGGLTAAVAQGNDAVRNAASAGHGTPTMGTTLTMAYVRFPLVYVAQVGDSRCYLWRKGNLTQLTRDHTVAQKMRDELHEDIQDSPFEHVLWNALGGGDSAQHRPEIARHSLEVGDALLLCSDGLSNELTDDQMAAIIGRSADSTVATTELVRAANDAGGNDNITAVFARCVPAG